MPTIMVTFIPATYALATFVHINFDQTFGTQLDLILMAPQRAASPKMTTPALPMTPIVLVQKNVGLQKILAPPIIPPDNSAFCLDKCHYGSWHLLKMVPGTCLEGCFVKIGSVTAEKIPA